MSEVKVNKISPKQNCTQVTLGDSGDTFVIPSGVTITNNGTQTGFGRTGTVDWDTTAKTTNFTAVSGNGYFVNTTSGAITVTLPATPSAGDIVAVSDYAGTSVTNNITVARNSSNIEGSASDLTIENNGIAMTFVYVDGTRGWKVTGAGREADRSNVTYMVATGGTITEDGDYKIHTFTGPGTFTVCEVGDIGTVDYLVVAGGGAGGVNRRGGGGGGGFRASSETYTVGCAPGAPLINCVSALPVTAQAYPITVGAGASGSTSPTPNDGNSSIFSTITSAGGGGAYTLTPSNDGNGGPGGSGGGGYGPTGTGGTGNTPPVSPSQGNPGGTGAAGTTRGGGGGGAIAAGQTGPGADGSPGGNGAGVPNAFGTSGENCGSYYYFSGGGGGGNTPSAIPSGTGGIGGGGNGTNVTSTAGQSGTTNTGGGGGGAGQGGPASNGGSGIVIIRYKYQ